MSLLHCIYIEMNYWNYKDVGWFVCLEGPPLTRHF